MAKALMGTMTTPRAVELLDEIRALRRRVGELEDALAAAEAARSRREAPRDEFVVTIEDAPEPVAT